MWYVRACASALNVPAADTERGRERERESSSLIIMHICSQICGGTSDLKLEDVAQLVDVPAEISDERLRGIEEIASGMRADRFTLAAVSQDTRAIAGRFSPVCPSVS